MSTFNDILTQDATSQADAIRRGEVTALELTEAAISNIEALDPHLNSVVITMFEQAVEAAEGPLSDGPFAGVPFLMKNMVAEYAGTPYTASAPAMANNISTTDSEIVKRYKSAGFVTLGKTNTPQFAIGPATEPSMYGPTHNPWDPDLSCGGSSGGSAAAVAAGFTAVAHGNDGGGSIRIPSSCCGLVGLKPTRGRNPVGPRYSEVWGGLVCDHVLTRSVRDSAAVLDATAGPEHGSPYWAGPDQQTYLSATTEVPNRLRIGFVDRTYSNAPIHDDNRAAVHSVAQWCENLGHQVELVTLPIDGEFLFNKFTTLLAACSAMSLNDLDRSVDTTLEKSQFDPLFWGMAEVGNRLSAADYMLAKEDLHSVTRAMSVFHDDYDVLLTPTLGLPGATLGEFAMTAGDDPIDVRRRMGEFAPFPQLQNVTGQPAISLPLIWNDGGLPIGTQFVSRYGDELTLLSLATQLEQTHGWHDRWPSISIKQ